ncbi:MAG: hypothetical protein WCX31_07810 [Salinivirgaceae bacterium]|jgi:hypothetical protein
MVNDLTTVINEIASEKKKLYYKGFCLDDSLASIKYLKSFGIYPENRWENIAKIFVGVIYKSFRRKKMTIQSAGTLYQKKILVAINFPADDRRHSKILLDFVFNYPMKGDIVVFTNQKSIYEICKNDTITCVYIINPLFNYDFNSLFKGYTYKESLTLNNFKNYIDVLPKYLDQTNVKLILTTQDVLRPDYNYAIIGKKQGLTTVTHQHGSIPDADKTLYSLLTSDYMLVWGESSKRNLMRSISPERLKVVGTTKFNRDSKNTKFEGVSKGILITPTIEPFEPQKKIIEKLLFELKEFSNISIKLHPMHNYKKWKAFIEVLMSESKASNKIQIIQGFKETIYFEFEILINMNSSSYLEGLLGEISIIELDLNRELSTPIKSIKESYVAVENTAKEILNRLNNPEYSASIIKKQNELLKQDLASTGLELEYSFINELLSKQPDDR